jgi:hypothetical protein
MLMRRAWPERIGGFDTNQSRAADVDFFLRLALAGCAMDWLRRPVRCYRQHGGNMTRNAVEQAEGLGRLLGRFFARPELPPHIKRLERGVRFHSLVWSAWRMSCTGQCDQIADWLTRSLVWSPYSTEESTVQWVRQFAAYDSGSSRTAADVWLPAVRRATQAAEANHERSDALLYWWARVWSNYLEGDRGEALASLAGYQGVPWGEVLALAEESLQLSPAERKVEATDHFWADAVTLGLVPRKSRAAAGLYLTSFGQAALAGKWEPARHALAHALGVGLDRRAALTWVKFLCKAVAHAAATLRGQA